MFAHCLTGCFQGCVTVYVLEERKNREREESSFNDFFLLGVVQDLQDLKEVMVLSGVEQDVLQESKAAKRLAKRVDRLIQQADSVMVELQAEKERFQVSTSRITRVSAKSGKKGTVKIATVSAKLEDRETVKAVTVSAELGKKDRYNQDCQSFSRIREERYHQYCHSFSKTGGQRDTVKVVTVLAELGRKERYIQDCHSFTFSKI